MTTKTIKLKTEERFDLIEEWLLNSTSTYQINSKGFAQYNLPRARILSDAKEKKIYLTGNKNTIDFLEERIRGFEEIVKKGNINEILHYERKLKWFGFYQTPMIFKNANIQN